MSDTPRSDESPEFRDPTAPSDPTAPGDHTAPIDTSTTQAVPPVPPAPTAPESDVAAADAPAAPGPATAGQGYGPPGGSAPQSPYATPPQNPYATPPQNPYASAPPPPASPYGQPPYGQTPYGAPPAAYAAPAQMSGSTIALLIVGGLTTLSCGFGILGLIFGIIAAAKKDQPVESAKYTRWGWIAVIAGLVLSIIAVIAFVALIAVGSSSSNFNTGY